MEHENWKIVVNMDRISCFGYHI